MKNKKIYIFLLSSLVISTFLISCNEDSIDKENAAIPYEPIGGYANSDEIASDNLVAKFSFENNLDDTKNNITGALSTNIDYANGIKGNAYNGSNSQERYAIANASSVITSLNNYTISFWMNSANTVDPATPGQGKGAQGIIYHS